MGQDPGPEEDENEVAKRRKETNEVNMNGRFICCGLFQRLSQTRYEENPNECPDSWSSAENQRYYRNLKRLLLAICLTLAFVHMILVVCQASKQQPTRPPGNITMEMYALMIAENMTIWEFLLKLSTAIGGVIGLWLGIYQANSLLIHCLTNQKSRVRPAVSTQ